MLIFDNKNCVVVFVQTVVFCPNASVYVSQAKKLNEVMVTILTAVENKLCISQAWSSQCLNYSLSKFREDTTTILILIDLIVNTSLISSFFIVTCALLGFARNILVLLQTPEKENKNFLFL